MKVARTFTPRTVLLVALGIVALSAAGSGLAIGLSSGDGRDTSQLPPGKQRILDSEAEYAATSPTTNSLPPDTMPPAKNPPRVPGIVDTGNMTGPFPGSEFSVTDMWRGPVGGRWDLIYAGGFLGPDESVANGGIRVYSEPIDPNAADESLTFVGDFPSDSTTPLKITDANGPHLTLTTPDGQSLSFNALTETYTQ